MERGLRPDRLETLPTAPDAPRIFKHWLFVFTRFKNAIEGGEDSYLGLLANYLSPENFELISDCTTFTDALKILKDAFIQPINEVVARHRLSTHKQESGETVDEYLRSLYKLSVDCNFRSVSAEAYRDEYVRDAFISGLCSQNIRTRLLENKTLNLAEAINQARALEVALKDSLSYDILKTNISVASAESHEPEKLARCSVESDTTFDPISAAVRKKNELLFLR
ncbi:UNVERIFIED_CONTAM: hypothetical protein RMT77_016229 [Armadillidium vulgare]